MHSRVQFVTSHSHAMYVFFPEYGLYILVIVFYCEYLANYVLHILSNPRNLNQYPKVRVLI